MKRSSKPPKSPAPTFRGDSSPDSASAGGGSSRPPFPVVGIGASAGGLEALETLLGSMEPEMGMAFVIVTHQHPGHITMLPELLAGKTRVPVLAANDGIAVEPDHIYVAPPGGQLGIFNGRLQRMDSEVPEPPHLPIDHFFRSLAEDQRERAICIILSGTGTDGTLGLKAVKGESGMAMAQQPQTAKYAGMPSSAISTGLVDYILPPQEMPARLAAYARGPYLTAPTSETKTKAPGEPMQKIFMLLRSRTGNDFSNYKASTIRRRIERRMNIHQIKGSDQYVRFLQDNPHEVDILFKELLISVTCFFRDREAFESLATNSLPALLESRPDHCTLRGWVPGCATGEEVYSLAILLREAIEDSERPFSVQLFGTDLDNAAIETARNGKYPDGISADIAPSRLHRYFLHDDSGFRVRKDIREMVVFAVQNVIKDPPFTKLDLISCRNLMIYLDSDLQKKLLPVFHYALTPGGLLFLGPSETIGGFSDLFEQVDKKWKIFRRKETPLPPLTMLNFPMEAARVSSESRAQVASRQPRQPGITSVVESLLLNRFVPASVVVNDRGDVIFIHGRTGRYLEPAPGQPRLNIHDMAREGLEFELSNALRHATAQDREVVRENVRVRTNGGFSQVDFTVVRLEEPKSLRGFFLVTFRDRPAPEPAGKSGGAASEAGETTRIAELERELQHVKESLQTTIEELETSNEELKSTNEELQSTNEELQSTNEELETSTEEMQSLNEELTTVNAELQSKVEELLHTNDDMQNLLNSTEIATIFLDGDLKIKRYTEQAKRLVNLIQTDIGRPLSDLASSLEYDHLVPDSEEVLRTLVFRQAEVRCRDGNWYLMRIMPYRTAENVIDGLVLTFVDINPIKNFESELDRAKQRLAADLEAMTRLQEIGTSFVRGSSLPQILEEVLDTALLITGTEKGTIQLFDKETNRLEIVLHRGLPQESIGSWSTADPGRGACGVALRRGEAVIVGNIATDPNFNDREVAELLQAGVHAVLSIPLMRGEEAVGVLSTHFTAPHTPDDRSLRMLDLLARQAAEIIGRSGATEPPPDA